MAEMTSAVVNSVKIPVTVKTRLGWDKDSIIILDVSKSLEQAGIAALTVHCRTREQGHKGSVDYSWIPRIKEAVSIPVIVNGDIVSPQNVKAVFDSTGCDAVMIGRGAVLNPWIFRQAKQFLKEHLRLSVAYKGERAGVIELRKHYAGFLRGLPHVSKIRMELMQYTEAAPIMDHLTKFLELYSPRPEPA